MSESSRDVGSLHFVSSYYVIAGQKSVMFSYLLIVLFFFYSALLLRDMQKSLIRMPYPDDRIGIEKYLSLLTRQTIVDWKKTFFFLPPKPKYRTENIIDITICALPFFLYYTLSKLSCDVW